MKQKRKLHDYDVELNGVFECPEKMALELDSLLYFLQHRYSSKESEIPSMFGFIVTEIEVLFSSKFRNVKLQSDLASNSLFICAPSVPKSEEESRRLFLLNSFSDVIKTNQISSLVDLFRLLKPEAKEKLINSFNEFRKKSQQRRE